VIGTAVHAGALSGADELVLPRKAQLTLGHLLLAQQAS